MVKPFLVILIFISLYSCKDSEAKLETDYIKKDTYYTEKYRPQFHFSPEEKWMNDPNGLVYNNGTYHLFYQFYPDSTVWGPMHWGHATSKDLINWKHKPVALKPDTLGYIFSGSAVVDKNNTSGFGSDDNPPLVAMFTYHDEQAKQAGEKNYETQAIAFSLDEGETWKKYKGNPVIGNENNLPDFRDPKLFWHDGSNQWIMVLVAGDHAKFYNSKDLRNWNLTSEFGQEFGAHSGVWECPDLFRLPVDGAEDERWVLLISIGNGAPNGGSGTQYFVGAFDGKRFIPDHLDTRWIDYGQDNYAGVTYNHAPNGKRIFIGWMSNWQYAQDTPTKKWRSAMTIPRQLSLYRDGEEIKLKSYPIDAVSELHTSDNFDVPTDYNSPILLKTNKRKGADITFDADLSKPLQIRLSNNAGEALVFTANPEQQTLYVDRSKSGKTEFGKMFADQKQTQPYKPLEKLVEVRMLVDASSVEIFVDKGKYVFTNQVFPNVIYSNLNVNTVGNEAVKNLEIKSLKSVWKDAK